MFPISKKSRFFVDPLRKVKKYPKNSKINNIGSHDGLKKNITKMPLIPVFFIHPVYFYLYCELRSGPEPDPDFFSADPDSDPRNFFWVPHPLIPFLMQYFLLFFTFFHLFTKS